MQTSEIRTQTTCLEVSIYLPPSIYLGTVTKLHSTQVLPLLLGGTTTVENTSVCLSLSRAYAMPYISPLLTCLPT